MSESASKHAVPISTEPSNPGKTRAQRSEPHAHATSSKGKQAEQSLSSIEDLEDESVYTSGSDSQADSTDWSHEEVDEIDPDDSISATAKQQPDHGTKPSASHQKSVPHQRRQSQSVPSSVYMESGAVGSQVSPYPYNGFLRPGPQGVARRPPRRAPPPAPYYGNSGYMPPYQDPFARPYWERPPYEEGKEMMPYQMSNPFFPAQGARLPPADPVGREPQLGFKRTRKGKERFLTAESLRRKSRPDGPTADQGRPGKGSGKSEDDAASLRLPAEVDAVYNSCDARNLTVHLELDLFRDMDEELEEFNRLARMGNFAAADSLFESCLKEHMSSDPSIFVQYAEMLLEKGDYKTLLLLDGDSVFGRRGLPGRKGPEKSESKELLEMNWILVRALALFHSQHKLHRVWSGIKTPLHNLSKTSGVGSTELRIVSLGMRLTRLAPDRTIPRSPREKGLGDWANWKSIYRQLLAEQRIWDFRDVLIEACVSYDTKQALSAFLDHTSPIEGMIADWRTGTPDESTDLALLDLLSFIALNSDRSLEGGGLVDDCLCLAEPIGNSLLDRFPHTVHSRPFIQWLVYKAVVNNSPEQFAYLSDYAGLGIYPKSAGVLPYYIPIREENPGWVPQSITPAVRDVLEATLKASRDMQDHITETLCLTQLALGTKDPGEYLQQLGQLQEKQHNMAGFLRTCLTRYLICRDDESKQALLEDLNGFGLWKYASDLIMPTEAAARDVLQLALSKGSAKNPSPSVMSTSRHSAQLPDAFESIFGHLKRPGLAETGEEHRPPTETSRVEQHSESEDETQESSENSTWSRDTRNGGSRLGTKYQARDDQQPAAPDFYPGPWNNYEMPPYYPMNMMYSAQPPPPPPPPPPTEPPPQRPPPAAEEYRPSPEMARMQKQLELLQAERRQQEEAKKQADLESKIREDAERVFRIRMEEMQRAQEEAKKEIGLAKIAAERAARERIEGERKAEAERQRQHAEMMAKAERDARDRIEKERKEEAEQRARAEMQRALIEAKLRAQGAREERGAWRLKGWLRRRSQGGNALHPDAEEK